MSDSQMVKLDDTEVGRKMAGKAVNDQVFKDQLSAFATLHQKSMSKKAKGKITRAVLQTMEKLREQIVDQAGLRKPPDAFGSLNTYLRQVKISRVLSPKPNVKKEDSTEDNLDDDSHEWGWVVSHLVLLKFLTSLTLTQGSLTSVGRLAFAFLQSNLRFQADPTPFPFERLPPELRLQVYREALRGAARGGTTCADTIVVCRSRNGLRFQYDGQSRGDSKDIDVSLLAVSSHLNNETVPILYQLRTFEFETNVGKIVPFLSSLSEAGRKNLRGISMELHSKQEPLYCCGSAGGHCFQDRGKGPDNKAAWGKACTYIATNLKLKELSVAINVKVPAEFSSLKWVKDLVKIKGLKHLTLKADQHAFYLRDVPVRACYDEGLVSAADHCYSEHLVPLFEFLCVNMLE